MAKSSAHQWGQIIGDLLEASILPLLEDFAARHGLYLDKKGPRPARKSKKVTWIDINKNRHDLDFVLERGGSPDVIGIPVAFIETAWRRYTKHSRNKVQEIQGAIEPLVAAHRKSAPFMGAVLAGEFTRTSIQQLRSLNFSVLNFSYDSTVQAFAEIDIDAASDVSTPESKFVTKVKSWSKTPPELRKKVADALLASNKTGIDEFILQLDQAVKRTVETVSIMPLHGLTSIMNSVASAIKFIEDYSESGAAKPISYYLVQIRYNNHDQIEGRFSGKHEAIQFLRDYEPLLVEPAVS